MVDDRKTLALVSRVRAVIDAAQIDQLFETEIATIAQRGHDTDQIAGLDDQRHLTERFRDGDGFITQRCLHALDQGLIVRSHSACSRLNVRI